MAPKPHGLRIDLTPLRELADAFHVSVEELDRAQEGMGTEIAAYLERQTVLGTPRDQGILAGGIVGDTARVGKRFEAFVGVQGAAMKYAWPVELGAKPHWPPRAPIEGWVRRKKLSWTDTKGRPLSVASMTFLIRRAIATYGTIKRFGYKGAEMAGRALTKSEGVIEQIIVKHVQLFLDRLGGKGG